MAIGQKSGGRDFQAGTSGNPSGRPREPGDVKDLRRKGNLDIVRTISAVLAMSRGQFQEFSEKEDLSINEQLIVSILNRGIAFGDPRIWEVLMNRYLGRVPMLTHESEVGPASFAEFMEQAIAKEAMRKVELVAQESDEGEY